MRTVLIVTGVLSALLLAFPGIVAIGLILFVIPGLILMSIPTAFLYLLATWLIRLALPIKNTVLAYAIAAASAVALASLAVLPIRMAAQRNFAAAIQPEIIPSVQIALSGHILYEKRSDISFSMDPSCNALCLAMLDLEDVTAVTMVRDGIAKTFALRAFKPGDENTPTSLEPYAPSEIIDLANQ